MQRLPQATRTALLLALLSSSSLAPTMGFMWVVRPVHSLAWYPTTTATTVTTMSTTTSSSCLYSSSSSMDQADRIQRVLEAKKEAGLSFDDLAIQLGVTNTYAAQLVLGQAKLTAATAPLLQQALPTLAAHDVQAMQDVFPMRGYKDEILKEPHVYRTYEAITHYGEAIKSIINEQCGDGIMSAIDFYCDVGTTTGVKGEQRVVITFNGKFLPFIEQRSADNTVKSPRD
jgi:cyanate lyase